MDALPVTVPGAFTMIMEVLYSNKINPSSMGETFATPVNGASYVGICNHSDIDNIKNYQWVYIGDGILDVGLVGPPGIEGEDGISD